MVERVALALAPRACVAAIETLSSRETPTTLQPILVEAAPGDDQERLQQRVLGFDHGWSGNEEITTAEEMVKVGRSLLIGGPGMGKTTLLGWLPTLTDTPSARGELKGFAPGRDDAAREDAIARLLAGGDGPVAREDLDGDQGVLGLDGFDEIEEHLRDRATAAILAAVERWPHQHWLVTSRPCAELQALTGGGFTEFHIVPSRRWARRYLEARSVPQERVRHAMLDGYGLGDLLGIPVFAARLADRLLDEGDEIPGPLQLLVEEQYAASAREARKAGKPQADLAEWMRSLAVALELRGRSSAPAGELALVPGPDGLGGEQARERLVRESLLADIPRVVAFPLKTLQEGLCADAILKAADPVAVLRHVACADVAGVERLREDMELTIDLVFEHADRSTRQTLRALDETRWARTVVTNGTEQDAREALEIVHTLHVHRGVAYGIFGDGALRSSRQMVAALGTRWPAVIGERREELEADSRSADATDRLRALETLAALEPDDYTEGWLLPRLADEDPRVIEQAVAIAGRVALTSAELELRLLLDSKESRVRKRALAALVEIVEMDGLVEVGTRAARVNGLQPIFERLLERLDLDHGIELVRQAGPAPDGALAALLQRLTADAAREAWTPRRVNALMLACANLGGVGGPEAELLAGIFERHPDAALEGVRVQRVGDGPWGPLGQLVPLSHLDPALLAGAEHEDLRSALSRALRESAEVDERQHHHEREMERLLTVLDETGAEAEPDDLPKLIGALHTLTPRRGEIVAELVKRWWPASGLAPAAAEEDLDERTRAMLQLGASARAAIGDERWIELLDAHLAAGRFGDWELSDDRVVAWLAYTYAERFQPELLQRLRGAVDADAVSRLVAIAGRPSRAGAVADAAVARLHELGRETPGWANAVGLLAEAAASVQLRALLKHETSADSRRIVIRALARHGDGQAQLESLRELTAAVQRGEDVERQPWQGSSGSPELIGAAAELADAALAAGQEELAGFALALLGAPPSEKALAALQTLVDAQKGTRPWMGASVEQLARRIATRAALERLPEVLGQVAAEFARVAEPA
jgi:hypothetical protein